MAASSYKLRSTLKNNNKNIKSKKRYLNKITLPRGVADEEDKYDSHENGCKVLLSSSAAATSPLSPAAVMSADPAPVAVGRAAAAGAGNLELRGGGGIFGKMCDKKKVKFPPALHVSPQSQRHAGRPLPTCS